MILEFIDNSDKVFQFQESEIINERIHFDVASGKKGNIIWLFQLKDVYTIGKANAGKISTDVDCHVISRGGDMTFHNKGQLMVYFFIKVDKIYTAHFIISKIENSIARSLQKFNCETILDSENRGVWVKVADDNCKIASIGLSFSNKVSKYGAAININNDLLGFNKINPCGLRNCKMINLKQATKQNKLEMQNFVEIFKTEVLKDFN